MPLSPGDRLGPYEILALIGKGGMGEVYRARDPRLNRDVAIKISNAQFTERFTREARAIAALNHTNICHLYDVGPDYLVMEYVEGQDLRGPMDFEDALPVIQQLIEGIEAAHEKNIVHRDLKPANIKITPEGVFKILPKGDRIVFSSNRKGAMNLYQKAANGSGQDEPVLPNGVNDFATQWSRDGRFIVYFEQDPQNKYHLWVLPAEGAAADRKPIQFLRTEFNELHGQLSPDSHWMAFTSERSERREVYVRPFPNGEGESIISLAGGEQPRWRGDGKELFFEAADGKMMAVPVIKAVAGAKPSFEAGAPVALFDAHMVHFIGFQYDVTADGKRFLVATEGSGAASPPLTVVTNWQAGVKK